MINRIIIVAPCLTMGGMERASASLANYFASEKLIVSYISIFKKPHFFILDQSIYLYEPPAELNNRRLNLFKTIWWLRKTIRKSHPSAVLVFNKFYGALVASSLILDKTPLLVSERSSPLYKWSTRIKVFNRLSFIMRSPQGIIAQTYIAADYQSKYYSTKTQIRVIPNAIRFVKLFPDIIRQKKILAVGRLTDPLKGFDRLIEAFAKLRNQEWLLIFAGGDEEGVLLKEQAKRLKVDHKVRFLGKVKNMDSIYAECGIFVIPSRSEGFPNALCEAMAAGLPCISFNFVAGPGEIITNGHDGLIVEDGNIDALSKSIEFLIEHPQERDRLGQNALKIRDRLKLEKIGHEYLNFILDAEGARTN